MEDWASSVSVLLYFRLANNSTWIAPVVLTVVAVYSVIFEAIYI